MSYFRDNIEKMAGYTPGFQPESSDAVKLNTNENPYLPSQKVIDAIKTITADELRRYPNPVGQLFRLEAAKVYGVEPANIICSNGGDDLLTIAVRSFCDVNSAMAYPVLTYSLYPVLAKIQNCPVIEIPFGDGGKLPKQLADTGAALTIVCNPNAPTGSVIEVDELADLADKLDGILLIDEAYVDFAEDNCIRLIKDFDNVIILRSMSKGYSLAGVRFGCGIANCKLIEAMAGKVKDSYNVDAVSIKAAAAAIKDQQYFKANVEKIKSQRQQLTEQLRQLGFGVNDSFSNFVLATVPDGNGQGVYDRLAENNIYVRYWNNPGLSDKLRITVGRPEENQQLIEMLKKVL